MISSQVRDFDNWLMQGVCRSETHLKVECDRMCLRLGGAQMTNRRCLPAFLNWTTSAYAAFWGATPVKSWRGNILMLILYQWKVMFLVWKHLLMYQFVLVPMERPAEAARQNSDRVFLQWRYDVKGWYFWNLAKMLLSVDWILTLAARKGLLPLDYHGRVAISIRQEHSTGAEEDIPHRCCVDLPPSCNPLEQRSKRCQEQNLVLSGLSPCALLKSLKNLQ